MWKYGKNGISINTVFFGTVLLLHVGGTVSQCNSTNHKSYNQVFFMHIKLNTNYLGEILVAVPRLSQKLRNRLHANWRLSTGWTKLYQELEIIHNHRLPTHLIFTTDHTHTNILPSFCTQLLRSLMHVLQVTRLCLLAFSSPSTTSAAFQCPPVLHSYIRCKD